MNTDDPPEQFRLTTRAEPPLAALPMNARPSAYQLVEYAHRPAEQRASILNPGENVAGKERVLPTIPRVDIGTTGWSAISEPVTLRNARSAA